MNIIWLLVSFLLGVCFGLVGTKIVARINFRRQQTAYQIIDGAAIVVDPVPNIVIRNNTFYSRATVPFDQ